MASSAASFHRLRPALFIRLAVVALALGTAYWWRTKPLTVRAVHPQMRTVVESISASGRVHGQTESNIGAAGGGKVLALFVKEGSRVAAGQKLALLDPAVLRAQVRQAEAGVVSSRAELSRAARPPLPSEIARLRADIAQNTAVALAKLNGARKRLDELSNGATREEKAQALSQLRAAQARLAQAKREVERQQQLVDDGVPKSQSEAAQSAVVQAEAALEQTTSQLELAKRDAARQQQLFDTNASAELDRAETALRVAEKTLDKSSSDLALAKKEAVRQQQLFDGGAVPRAELERALAALTATQAAQELAMAQRDQAKLDRDRQRTLLNEGSVPRAELERTRTVLRVAEKTSAQAQEKLAQARRDLDRARQTFGASGRAALENAQFAERAANAETQTFAEKLRQVEIGPRPEQIAQARAEVSAAAAADRGALASGPAQLRTLLSQPRAEDVAAAQARVSEAEEALLVARQRLSEATVTAPFGGVITEIVTEPGGVPGPGQPILRLVRAGVPEIRVDVDENNLGRLALGQQAIVTSEAFPGKRFNARLRQIGEEVDAQRGTVEVRLDPLRPPAWLRTGQTLNVNIIVDPGSRRLTVPLTAVKSAANLSVVMLAQNGRAVLRHIVTGPAGPDSVPVKSGLSKDDLVILDAVVDGQKIQSKPETVKARD